MHVISLRDIGDTDLRDIVARGAAFAADRTDHDEPLRGRIIGVYFSKTSTRTRTAFTTGALRLGAKVIAYGPADLQTNTGETLQDTARVLGGMLDGLVIRTAGSPLEMRTFAEHCGAVVNAMSADEHPTQGLTDLTTLQVHFGQVEDLSVVYLGEGNNTAAALALALPRFAGTHLDLRTPPGYGLDPALLAEATALAARHGSRITERHDLTGLPQDADAVYTTRWQTTGTSKPDPDWQRVFAPFRVDAALLEQCPKAVFLHDLPAHRGEDVTADVLEGPASIAFVQAQHKLHSAMAVLEWCRP